MHLLAILHFHDLVQVCALKFLIYLKFTFQIGGSGTCEGDIWRAAQETVFYCTKALKSPSTPAAPEMNHTRISGGEMQALFVFSKTPCAEEIENSCCNVTRSPCPTSSSASDTPILGSPKSSCSQREAKEQAQSWPQGEHSFSPPQGASPMGRRSWVSRC